MRILVLGGTVFLSEAVAAEAVRRGHEVVCACRGQSGPGAGRRRARRARPRRRRLAVRPDRVRRGRRRLPDAVARARGGRRGARRALGVRLDVQRVRRRTPPSAARPDTVPVLAPVTTDEDWTASPEAYGAMKVGCEQIVQSGAASSVVIRPGLIVGPGDPSGRFTYWPVRLAEPGPVLAPPADDVVQTIDVRDLADWVVTAAERRLDGRLRRRRRADAAGGLPGRGRPRCRRRGPGVRLGHARSSWPRSRWSPGRDRARCRCGCPAPRTVASWRTT